MDYVKIESGGIERTYGIYIPIAYDPAKSTPLILDFHSSGSDPEKQASVSRFKPIADRAKALVVRPWGKFLQNGLPSWNANLEPGEVDDIQFVLDIIAHLQQSYNIDTSRIYGVGFSGGARMVSRLACEVPDVFAGMAMVAGLQYPDDCAASTAVPIIAFHGKEDAVNPYDLTLNSPVYWNKSVEDSVADWVVHYDCVSENTEDLSGHVVRASYSDCFDNAEIQFFSIDNAGHTWPGNRLTTWLGLGETNMEVHATRRIWSFFNR
ncbi:MAG: PHB depolymerase family esterase [Ketobacteraceae bacterium]|nr:PHB depolymerase family esterase [Ketobacteraceae bacterium]